MSLDKRQTQNNILKMKYNSFF